LTVVVGLIDKERIWMGGDSLGSAGWDCTTRKDPKVFRKDEFLIGFTSSFRMGQLLRYKFVPPKFYEGDIFEYMVCEFVDSLRNTFKDGGFASSNEGEEKGGAFLVGFKGRLFEIESDYQVGEPLNGMAAVGCGSAYALGALYASQTQRNPRTRIQEYSNGCRAPFTILEQTWN
jgi:ATP-dependent protease HslVU (ClpYQ) peptidase subunit